MNITGKWMCAWQIKNCRGGNAQAFAEQLHQLKIRHLIVKGLDGPYNYNLRNVLGVWIDNLIGPLIAALSPFGIDVWLYQYIYGISPEKEAEAAISRIDKYHPAGFMIDAEGEIERLQGNADVARRYMKVLRAGTNIPIGLSSFRFPTVHAAFPWHGFLDNGVDLHMPQVYWVQARNAGEQLIRSCKELMAFKELPIVPIGAAYGETVGGVFWRPTVGEMLDFDQTAHELHLPGVAWWSWDSGGIEKYPEYELAVAGMNWEPVPEPQPPVVKPEQKLDLLWQDYLTRHPERPA